MKKLPGLEGSVVKKVKKLKAKPKPLYYQCECSECGWLIGTHGIIECKECGQEYDPKQFGLSIVKGECKC